MEKEAVCGVYLRLQQLQLFLFQIPGNLREKENGIIFLNLVYINPMHTKYTMVKTWKVRSNRQPQWCGQ